MTGFAPAALGASRLAAAAVLAVVFLTTASSALEAQAQAPARAPGGTSPAPGASEPSRLDPVPGAPRAAPRVATPEARQPSDILGDRPDAGGDRFRDLLGETFESKAQGIAMRPPKDMTAIRRTGGNEIVEFVNPDTGWVMKVSVIRLTEHGSLTESPDARGRMQPGVLEATAARLKDEIPDGEFLRNEPIPVPAGDAGILVVRHTQNLKPVLSQQAIIKKAPRVYYVVAMTTPGAPKGSKEGSAVERQAVATFNQVLDNVQLLDQEAIRADQNMRLFNTRALLLRFQNPAVLREALIPEQWARVLKGGKDIGYIKTLESDRDDRGRPIVKGSQEGIEIRTRSRTLPRAEVQLDTGSIQFVSVDLHHEDWSTLTVQTNPKQKPAPAPGAEVADGAKAPPAAVPAAQKPPQVAEFGVSDRREILGRGNDWTLEVIYESNREQIPAFTRPLPPFYLPQAVSYLLPRLVPLNQPKAYLFATYVPEQREVVMRYIDVKDQQRVQFNGENLRAIPVEDRLGLEGSITTHYMSPEGHWIGSENKDSNTMILPSTEKRLLDIWKDADLAAPEAPQRREGGAREDRDAPAADPPPQEDADDAPDPTPPARTAPKLGDRRRPPASSGKNHGKNR